MPIGCIANSIVFVVNINGDISPNISIGVANSFIISAVSVKNEPIKSDANISGKFIITDDTNIITADVLSILINLFLFLAPALYAKSTREAFIIPVAKELNMENIFSNIVNTPSADEP